MKVWVVKEGEPLPMLTGKGRLMRAGMLANTFASLDNDVIWWSSTWLHYEKRYYCNHSETIKLSDNLELNLLHVKHAYKSNISLQRIWYCRELANQFRKVINKYPQKPDLIYCSWPLIELSYECVKFGEKNNIPTIIDIRDFWPDIFIQPFPTILKPFAQFVVNCIYKKKTEFVMQKASKVISVVPSGLLLAKEYGRLMTNQDESLFLCFDNTRPSPDEEHNARKLLIDNKLSQDQFIVLLISSISFRIVQVPLIIDTASKLTDFKKIHFVICGDGSDLEKGKQMAEHLSNVHFLGYLNSNQLYAIKEISSIALLPYINTADFVDSLPNKFGEYLAGGLPIITTLTGLSRTILERNHCGEWAGTADDMNKIILKYYNNEEYLKTSQKNAIDLFNREFNAKKVYPRFAKQALEMI